MKKSRQRIPVSRSTVTKPFDPGCSQISSSDLARLWSAIQRVLPAVRLPKKPALMLCVGSASQLFQHQPTILTPDCVQLRLCWGDKSTPDQHCVSIVLVVRGSFARWAVGTDTPVQSSVVYAPFPKNSTKKDLAMWQT